MVRRPKDQHIHCELLLELCLLETGPCFSIGLSVSSSHEEVDQDFESVLFTHFDSLHCLTDWTTVHRGDFLFTPLCPFLVQSLKTDWKSAVFVYVGMRVLSVGEWKSCLMSTSTFCTMRHEDNPKSFCKSPPTARAQLNVSTCYSYRLRLITGDVGEVGKCFSVKNVS